VEVETVATTVDPSILALINSASVTTIAEATAILRANYITDPTLIATYILSSSNTTINPPATTTTPTPTSTANSGSITSIMGLAGSGSQLMGMLGGSSGTGTNMSAGVRTALQNVQNDTIAIQQDKSNIQLFEQINGPDGDEHYFDNLEKLTRKLADDEAKLTTDNGLVGPAELDARLNPPDPTGPQALMPKIGSGIMAAIMQYEVFSRAEAAAAHAVTATIAMLGAVYFGAIGATMLWLSKMSPFNPKSYKMPNPSDYYPTGLTGANGWLHSASHGLFTIHPNPDLFAFLMTLAVATAITSAVLAAGIIAGRPGNKDAPTTPTASAISNMLSQIPTWYNTLPTASVAVLSAGLAIGGISHSLSSGNTLQQFSVSSYAISQAATAAGSPGASIFVLPAQTSGGYDTVYVVTPGANGTSTVSMFQVDSNGYLVGSNGPDESYLPFETPIVNSSGTATGYTLNQGAFNALYQIPACTTIANDTSLDAKSREAALATCVDKNVQFIPIGGS